MVDRTDDYVNLLDKWYHLWYHRIIESVIVWIADIEKLN